MRRIHLFEFHDQTWFPSSFRHYVTDALQFGFNLRKVYAAIAPRLQSLFDSTGSGSIVDLCSGGGGPWLDLSSKLQCRAPGKSQGLQITLTDKYPNLEAFQSVVAACGPCVIFYADSVDAMAVPRDLAGVRTMFTSFHHFRPEEAQAILQNAVDAGESIGVFEIPQRSASTIAITFAFVFLLFVCTPWIRPFRWSRLLWTYLVPIVPVVLLFDGIVSCFRTYAPQELREMIGKLNGVEYQWETGEAGGMTPVTYLIGYPRTRGSDTTANA